MYKLISQALVFITLIYSGVVAAANYYRYENAEGRKVISQSVPADMVAKGYEILNSSGRVIKVVPRALTEEERALKQEQKIQRQLEAEQEVRDRKLLAIFSSPQDAIRARDRKLEAIDVYVNVTRGNILKLQNDFNQAQAQAAQRERAGESVPEYLLDKMESLNRQIRQAEGAIQEKEKEKQVIRAEYEKDIKRLEVLVESGSAASQ